MLQISKLEIAKRRKKIECNGYLPTFSFDKVIWIRRFWRWTTHLQRWCGKRVLPGEKSTRNNVRRWCWGIVRINSMGISKDVCNLRITNQYSIKNDERDHFVTFRNGGWVLFSPIISLISNAYYWNFTHAWTIH